ncbi:hypothetical protein [Modestobacter italicus]|uniref:hypothetical protein n=1 Tax=Modestobacter italicus (strain DSM 44449 / CECT 9708 / BC 501) TaxID=2732864 RepID=UPI001C95C48F|nr:hypothetical protein [Modestobacter italicus]
MSVTAGALAEHTAGVLVAGRTSPVVLAREYGPGLGYGPITTAVLAGLVIAGCAVVVLGYLAIRFQWWRQDRRESETRRSTRRSGGDRGEPHREP